MPPPRFVAGLSPPPDAGEAWWFAFRRTDLLVVEPADGGPTSVPTAVELAGLEVVRSQYLGQLDGRPCFAAELGGGSNAPPGHEFAGLRWLFARMEPLFYGIAGLAFQIQGWDRRHRFCPECREPLVLKTGERAKRCEA